MARGTSTHTRRLTLVQVSKKFIGPGKVVSELYWSKHQSLTVRSWHQRSILVFPIGYIDSMVLRGSMEIFLPCAWVLDQHNGDVDVALCTLASLAFFTAQLAHCLCVQPKHVLRLFCQ